MRAGRTARPRRERRRGFTLIEVLIAFAILAVAMLAALQAFSSGLRGLSAVEESASAVLHARSKLEEVGTSIPLEPGAHEGDFEDGYRWSVAIATHEVEDEVDPEVLPVVPYEVEVSVQSQGGRAVTLKTLRLAPSQ